MSLGERAALEGILTQSKPKLAIEVGTAEGGSLERIALHAEEVHSFDLVAPALAVGEEPHVHLHTGDSHTELPKTLAEFARAGRNVDLALVDGDHSADGVYRDVFDLLQSPAVAKTIILIHDVNHEEVRSGVERVPYASFAKVKRVELDWVPGYLFKEESLRNELWGGLGMILVDADADAPGGDAAVASRYYPSAHLFARMRDILEAEETGATSQSPIGGTAREAVLADRVQQLEERTLQLAEQVAVHNQIWVDMQNSVSWRLTAPLRVAKKLIRGRLSR
jgi:hypothetical protein